MKRQTLESVDKVVIHCSATNPDQTNVNVELIDQWHKNRGWEMIGYHFVIGRSGLIEKGRELTHVGAHVKGHNTGSIGICMVGGVDLGDRVANNFLTEQFEELAQLLGFLLLLFPKARIMGHRDLDNRKECPSFSVRWFLSEYMNINPKWS